MKKLFMLLVACGAVFASIGEFVITVGDVIIIRDDREIKATNGMKIENQDKIETSNKSKAQIKFEDGTIVSIGKNTNFMVNDYLYAQANSKVDMGVSSGSFKVITGNTGKVARNNFKFKANTMVIGIRGTVFAGEVGVADKKDVVACVQGGITVASNGIMKDVAAGRMVEVLNGKIGEPVAIDSSKIETISSFNSSSVNDENSKKDGSTKEATSTSKKVEIKNEIQQTKKNLYKTNGGEAINYKNAYGDYKNNKNKNQQSQEFRKNFNDIKKSVEDKKYNNQYRYQNQYQNNQYNNQNNQYQNQHQNNNQFNNQQTGVQQRNFDANQ